MLRAAYGMITAADARDQHQHERVDSASTRYSMPHGGGQLPMRVGDRAGVGDLQRTARPRWRSAAQLTASGDQPRPRVRRRSSTDQRRGEQRQDHLQRREVLGRSLRGLVRRPVLLEDLVLLDGAVGLADAHHEASPSAIVATPTTIAVRISTCGKRVRVDRVALGSTIGRCRRSACPARCRAGRPTSGRSYSPISFFTRLPRAIVDVQPRHHQEHGDEVAVVAAEGAHGGRRRDHASALRRGPRTCRRSSASPRRR